MKAFGGSAANAAKTVSDALKTTDLGRDEEPRRQRRTKTERTTEAEAERRLRTKRPG